MLVPLMIIGMFAQMSGLTPKTQRRVHDTAGVLAPADVDPTSGYRRY